MNSNTFYQKLITMFIALSLLFTAFAPTSVSAQSNQPPADWTPPMWVVTAAQANDAPPTFNVEGYQGVLTTFILARADALDMLDDEVEPKPFGSVLDTTDFEYFAQFTQGFTDEDMHGALTDKLDAQYPNVHRDSDGGHTFDPKPGETIFLWSGIYPGTDPTLGGKLASYLTEGDTGVWRVVSKVTVPTPSAWIVLKNWTGETHPREGTPALGMATLEKAQGCVANNTVEQAISRLADTEALFARLDQITNSNVSARVRNGWYSKLPATAWRTMVWTADGKVGKNWAPVSHSEGKTLYVATKTAMLEVMHPFSGTTLCNDYSDTSLSPVTVSAQAPESRSMCVKNSEIATLVNNYGDTDELYAALGLLPSTVYPAGEFESKWNTFMFSRGDISGKDATAKKDDVILDVDWTDDQVGFQGLFFGITDGTAIAESQYSVITFCKGEKPFSPADMFTRWEP